MKQEEDLKREISPPASDKDAQRAQLKRDALALAVKMAVIGLCVWLIFTFLFGLAVVSGEGMYPRLRDGDLTVFYRLDKSYDIGDVVTYRVNGQRYFGRVVAAGGDSVDVTKEGRLTVNGNIQQEEIFYDTYVPEGTAEYPLTVPEGGVYVLGDYRTRAFGQDSRAFGALDCRTQTDGTVISLLRRRGL